MYGNWIIKTKINEKRFEVVCNSCGYTTQKISSQLKTRHTCPTIIEDKKYCYKCKERKEIDFFHKDSSVADGYSKICKVCYSTRIKTKKHTIKPVTRRPYSKKRSLVNARSTKNDTIENFLNHRQQSLKYRHKRKQMREYNLPEGYLIEQYKKQNGMCFYTGKPLNFKTPFSAFSISVDKLYPSDGYTIGNVVLCTHSINCMKLNMTVDEFKEYLKSIQDGIIKFMLT